MGKGVTCGWVDEEGEEGIAVKAGGEESVAGSESTEREAEGRVESVRGMWREVRVWTRRGEKVVNWREGGEKGRESAVASLHSWDLEDTAKNVHDASNDRERDMPRHVAQRSSACRTSPFFLASTQPGSKLGVTSVGGSPPPPLLRADLPLTNSLTCQPL